MVRSDRNELTTKDKWERVWAGAKLPCICRPVDDVRDQLQRYLPRGIPCTLMEIGCAPGGWMAYFNKHFGYRVSGIEYAEAAAATTRKNMDMLAVAADIMVQDFFSLDCEQNKYDIVFSAGFIEHFRDLSPVAERICALSCGYVVTMVPNLLGVNGFIGKTIQSKVYAEHNPIDVSTLNLLHTDCGLRTLFCDHVGGVRLIYPGAHNYFFRKHRNCARAVNGPVRVFNRVSQEVGRLLRYTHRSRWVSDSLMYIGVKKEIRLCSGAPCGVAPGVDV